VARDREVSIKRASGILLAVVGVAIVLLGLVSAVHAYWTHDDYRIEGRRVSEVAAGDAGLATALRGIRGTAAAHGAGFGVLLLAIVLGPCRRGEVWAWMALLVAGLTQFVIVLLRIPILGTQLGAPAAVTLAVGLPLEVGRLERPTG
jgi:hypothetical protein